MSGSQRTQNLSSRTRARFTNIQSGWRGKQNGELLNLADANFDVLVTLDTNLKYQQNFSGRKIALVVIVAPSNRLIHLRPLFPALIETLKTIKSGEIVYLENKL